MRHLDEGTVHGWLDGALSADEGRRLEEHVAGCARCAAMVAEARGLVAASSRILEALDGGVGGQAGAHVGGQAGRRAGGQIGGARFAMKSVRAAAAVVIVAAGAAALVQVSRERDSRAGFSAARPAAKMGARQGESTVAASGAQAVASVATETSAARPAAPEPSTHRAALERRDAGARDSLALSDVAVTPGAEAEQAAPAKALPAPPARDGEGLTIVSDSVFRENGRVVRRSVYEVRPGVAVVLEATSAPESSADTVSAGQQMSELERAQRPSARTGVAQTGSTASLGATAAPLAARSRPVDATTVHTIQWVDAAGTDFTLSGPLSREELRALRRRIPPPAPRRSPAAP